MNQVLFVHIFQPFNDVPGDVKGLVKGKETARAFRDFGVEIALITELHDHKNPALI